MDNNESATLSTPPSTGLSGIQFPHLIDMFSMIPKDRSITTLRKKHGKGFSGLFMFDILIVIKNGQQNYLIINTMEYTLVDESVKRQTLPVFSSTSEDRPTTTTGISILDKKQEFNILEKLKRLRDQKQFCDVILEVRGTKLQAHKNILASWSPYLASKLFPAEPKVYRDYVVVNYDNGEVFADLLDFMYNGYVAPRETNFLQLLHLAVSFQIETLKNYCEEFLRCNLHLGNFVTSYFLSRKYRLVSLEEYIVGFLQLNLSDAVKQGEFLGLTAEKFNLFLSKGWMEKIKPEIKLFLIISWVGYDVQERERYLVLLLGHIDWSTVANDFLLEINRTDNFFTSHESSLYLLLQTLFSTGIPLGPYTDIFPVLRERHCSILNEVVSSSVLPVETDDFQQVTIVVKDRPTTKDATTGTEREDIYDTVDLAMNTDVNSLHFAEAEEAAAGHEVCEPAEPEVANNSYEDNSRKLNDDFGRFLESEIHEMNQKEKKKHAKTKTKKVSTKTEEMEIELVGAENAVSTSIPVTRARTTRRSKKVTSYVELAGMNEEITEEEITNDRENVDTFEEEVNVEDDIDREYKPDISKEIIKIERDNKTRDAILQQIKVNKPTKKRSRGSGNKPGKAIACTFKDCAYITKFDNRMEKHIKTVHMSTFELTCSYCQFNTREVRKFNHHMKEHFSGPPFVCDYPRCHYRSDRIGNLLSHKGGHTDERPFTCDCGMRFRTNNTLIAHKKVHLGKKDYVCPECNQGFATKNTMNQHMVTHSNVRPYLCDMCGFSTKFQSHLIAHKRIHTGEVFTCKFPKCTYSSPKRSQLKAHMRAHLGIREHVCSTCSKSFVERSHLIRHEKLHTNEKMKCEECDYSTTRKDKLKEHFARYHSEEAMLKPKKIRASTGKGTKAKKNTEQKQKSATTQVPYTELTAPMLVKWDHGGYSMSQEAEETQNQSESYCVLRDQLTSNEPIPHILSIDTINAQMTGAKDLDGDEAVTSPLTTVQDDSLTQSASTPQTLIVSPSSIGALGMVGASQLEHVNGAITTTSVDGDQTSQTFTIIQQSPGVVSQAQEYGGLSAFMALF